LFLKLKNEGKKLWKKLWKLVSKRVGGRGEGGRERREGLEEEESLLFKV